jgi:hypothetical protein
MRPVGTGLHDDLVQAHMRELEERACKGYLASQAREGRRKASEGAGRRSGTVWLATALRSAADRLDRPAADCR